MVKLSEKITKKFNLRNAKQTPKVGSQANKAPIKAQPKYPKNKTNNLVLANKKQSSPKGGGFKAFIGSK